MFLLLCFADMLFASATRVPPCPALSELRCSLQVSVFTVTISLRLYFLLSFVWLAVFSIATSLVANSSSTPPPPPGVDEHGPRLYQTDPSGTFSRYDAKAIGSGSEGAQTNLQDQYNKSMTMAEAQVLALSTLKQVMEEKISSSNVEIAVVTAAEKQFRLLSVAELDAIVAQLP
jgi:hypothetical protein